jgi:hypothetical protein
MSWSKFNFVLPRSHKPSTDQVVIANYVISSLLVGEDPNVAGRRAYSVSEVARAGHLFCFVRQYGIAFAVKVIHS